MWIAHILQVGGDRRPLIVLLIPADKVEVLLPNLCSGGIPAADLTRSLFHIFAVYLSAHIIARQYVIYPSKDPSFLPSSPFLFLSCRWLSLTKRKKLRYGHLRKR